MIRKIWGNHCKPNLINVLWTFKNIKHTVLCWVTRSQSTLCNPVRLLCPWDSPGKNTGVVCHVLLQGIFSTQGLNSCLPHCRQILYCLSHHRSSGMLEWVAYPFSWGPAWPRNQTRVSCTAGGFFTSWATREALKHITCFKLHIWNSFQISLNDFLTGFI